MSCVTNTTVRGRSASVATSSRRMRLRRLVVERGERLVHQQDVGLGRERARELDALAHAARELVRVVIGELGEARDLEPLVDLLSRCVEPSAMFSRTVSHGNRPPS